MGEDNYQEIRIRIPKQSPEKLVQYRKFAEENGDLFLPPPQLLRNEFVETIKAAWDEKRLNKFRQAYYVGPTTCKLQLEKLYYGIVFHVCEDYNLRFEIGKKITQKAFCRYIERDWRFIKEYVQYSNKACFKSKEKLNLYNEIEQLVLELRN